MDSPTANNNLYFLLQHEGPLKPDPKLLKLVACNAQARQLLPFQTSGCTAEFEKRRSVCFAWQLFATGKTPLEFIPAFIA